MSQIQPRLAILGTRGVPAAHGGFETFAERLALYLVDRGWRVTVYCQEDVATVTRRFASESWRGIERLVVQVATKGPAGTLEFDALCVAHAARSEAVSLVLGYNGAVFLPYLRLRGRPLMINMDGIEWRRPKWSLPVKAWFWVNEWIAAWTGQRLVADHPAIADHLATRRPRNAITVIPYGGEPVLDAPTAPLEPYGLEPDRYLISVARIEPDNSILPMVQAFSKEPRGMKLAVLGKLDEANAYHRAVKAAASPEVLFPGAIYEAPVLKALRFHARAYMHGHTVGGTNPSLVEALWAGNAVIAHLNIYNLWTAGGDQFFFDGPGSLEEALGHVLRGGELLERARAGARARARGFAWEDILGAYEEELRRLAGASASWPRPSVPAEA